MTQITHIISLVLTWMGANPVFTALIIWPILTAGVSWLFKPRSPAEYAAMPHWVASALVLLAHAGVDVPGLLAALRNLLKLPPVAPPVVPSGTRALLMKKPPALPREE